MANFTDDDLKRLLQQTNNPDIARTAQEQLDISKQNKDVSLENQEKNHKNSQRLLHIKRF